MKYQELKEKYQSEINALPLKFAFSNEQFKKAMEELGLTEQDTDKIVSIGAGGFCTPETADKLEQLTEEHHKLEQHLFNTDDSFVLDAFEYELGNHEYICTYDISETLYALGISKQDYDKNTRYQNLMKQAIKNYMREMERLGY